MSEQVGLTITHEGMVTRITLARPDRRNAQTPAMWRALAECARTLPASTRAVLIDAEGSSFSAGLDRQMLTPEGIPGELSFSAIAALDQPQEWIAQVQAAFTSWREVDAVVVAAVQGHAIGAGFQLALAADLVVAAESAQFAMRETSLGLVPDLGGTGPLVRAVGYARALEICLSGRFIGAPEALQLGLVASVVPDDELAAAAAAVARAAASAPFDAAVALKRLLAGAEDRSSVAQAGRERDAQTLQLRRIAAALGGVN